MNQSAAVADATVLIYPAKLGRLPDLWRQYGPVLVPASVYEEVVTQGKRLEHPDALEVQAAVEAGHLDVVEDVEVPDRLQGRGLERGDQAALAVALARGIGIVLTDDGGLRAMARAQGLQPRGTLSFLVQALTDGEISYMQYLEELERLTELGFRLSPELYALAVRRGWEIAGDPS